jgi:hypothetical protein
VSIEGVSRSCRSGQHRGNNLASTTRRIVQSSVRVHDRIKHDRGRPSNKGVKATKKTTTDYNPRHASEQQVIPTYMIEARSLLKIITFTVS